MFIKLIQDAKKIILKNFISIELAGSELVAWKLLFFTTFIRLHIFYRMMYIA